MIAPEGTLLVLLVILSVGLIIPEFFKRFKVPFVSTIILLGAILGPHLLNYVQLNETVEFLGFLGMMFLMLIAGLETNINEIRHEKKKIFVMAFLNGLIPFLVGFAITFMFNYSFLTSLLVGVVFISSSVAIIVPTLRDANLFHKKIGQLILSAVLVTDIISLVALGIILQTANPISQLPLPLHFMVLILSIFVMLYFLPKISKYALRKRFSRQKGHERQLRFVIIVVIGVLIYFSSLGVHPILAAFLVGLIFSSVIQDKQRREILYTKLHTIGYGLFIPVFFFIIGMEIDLGLLGQLDIKNVFMLALILGLILAKFISAMIAGKLVKLNKKDSMIFGSVSTVQLTTTLATVYAASSIGLIDSVIVTSIVLLSIITTLIGPWFVNIIAKEK
ncbi:cation:proton antiporter [Candidatus Pacearchaeota archaeon]|nr:cation:proton antiporter [Candidatus Pacearchaeota archaeon]